MKTIVWLNPTGRDKREITRLQAANDVQFIYHTYRQEALRNACIASQNRTSHITCRMPSDEIAQLSTIGNEIPIDGIMTSRDYPSNTIATAVAHNIGSPASSINSNIIAQHKYYARKEISQHLPDIMPSYELLSYDDIPFCSLQPPYIIKPVKAAGSLGTYYIQKPDDLHHVNNLPECTYYKPFAHLLEQYTPYRMDQPYVIAEQCATGIQVTADGFVWNGSVYMIGIVDSHFCPNTLSFSSFTYPSQLDNHVQQRMFDISRQCVTILGIDNTLFNIEFIYNKDDDTITLIEINPRMSSHFSPFYENVDNMNLYQIGLDIACGNGPQIPSTPGPYAYAESFVMRTYNDYFVISTPSSQQLQHIHSIYPNTSIEIMCASGKYLSEIEQDTFTYRYAIVNVVASSQEEADNTFEHIQSMLSFSFA